jgi:hypothetical protein
LKLKGGRRVAVRYFLYYWKNISYTTGCVSDRSVYPFAECNGAKDTAESATACWLQALAGSRLEVTPKKTHPEECAIFI